MRKTLIILMALFTLALCSCGDNEPNISLSDEFALRGENSLVPDEYSNPITEPPSQIATTKKPMPIPTTEKTTESTTTTEKPTEPPTTTELATTVPATQLIESTTEPKLNGLQTVTYSDGTVYSGNVVNGVRSGHGTYTWADGTIYTGEWVNGEPSENGSYTFPTTEPPVPEPKPMPTIEQKPQEATVYWVANGVVYHSTQNCRSLARSKNIRSGTIAQSLKERRCDICY